MSSNSRQFLTSNDIATLDRVLTRAGFHESADAIVQESRMDATRYLIASFQRGSTSETELMLALESRVAGILPIVPIALSDLSNHVASSTGHGSAYRFGRRIEADGRWTIYHVFTGVPAKYGAWDMVDLDIKTASRALKILNSPPATV